MNLFERIIVLIIAFITAATMGIALFKNVPKRKHGKIRIGIVDTGIDYTKFPREMVCDERDYTGTGIHDTLGHGTLVAGLILKQLKNPEKYCFVIYKYFKMNSTESITYSIKALFKATTDNLTYLNLSYNGINPDPAEKRILTYLLNQDVTITVAAGNESHNLSDNCDSYPGCYYLQGKFYVVSATDFTGQLFSKSNYGGPVNISANGFKQCYKDLCLSGTSFAAPNFLVDLINRREYNK